VTKDQRLKAWSKVADACTRLKGGAPLGDAVSKIVADLREEERKHKESAKAADAARAATPKPPVPPPLPNRLLDD